MHPDPAANHRRRIGMDSKVQRRYAHDDRRPFETGYSVGKEVGSSS